MLIVRLRERQHACAAGRDHLVVGDLAGVLRDAEAVSGRVAQRRVRPAWGCLPRGSLWAGGSDGWTLLMKILFQLKGNVKN